MNLFGLGPTELMIIAAILLLLFGPKRLPQIGKAIGQSAKAVRDGLEGKVEDEAEKAEPVKTAEIEAPKAAPVETVAEEAPYEAASVTEHDSAE